LLEQVPFFVSPILMDFNQSGLVSFVSLVSLVIAIFFFFFSLNGMGETKSIFEDGPACA
jgi:hypothetical protein